MAGSAGFRTMAGMRICRGTAALTFVALLTGCSHTPAPKAPGVSQIVAVPAPKDGPLTVLVAKQKIVVPQLAGACGGSGAPTDPPLTKPVAGRSATCAFNATTVPLVDVAPGDVLSMSALQSTVFSAAFAGGPSSKSALELRLQGATLLTAGVAPGQYTITIMGLAGGVWQMYLVVAAPRH